MTPAKWRETSGLLQNLIHTNPRVFREKLYEPWFSNLCAELLEASPRHVLPVVASLWTVADLSSANESTLAQTLHSLLHSHKLSPHRWSSLDGEIRRHLANFGLSRDPLPQRSQFLLSAPSGYLREEAISQLQSLSEPYEIALMISRCNDWVPKVARKAKSRLLQFDLPATFELTAQLLTSLEELLGTGRHNHSDLVSEIHRRLIQSTTHLQWITKTYRSHLQVRARKAASQFILHHRKKLPISYTQDFLRKGHRPTVLNYLKSLAHPSETDVNFIAETLAAENWAPITREVLTLMLQTSHPDLQNQLIKALIHPSRSIRGMARFHLEKFDQWTVTDFCEHYQKMLQAPYQRRTFRNALEGLATVDQRLAQELATQWIFHHGDERTLPSCIRSCDIENMMISDDQIFQWLQSPSSGVAEAVYWRTLNSSRKFSEAQLAQLCERSDTSSLARFFSYHLLTKRGALWERLYWLLYFSDHMDAELRTPAVHDLQLWLTLATNSYVNHPRDAVLRVQKIFLQKQSQIPPPLADTIAFHLKTQLKLDTLEAPP